MPITITKNQITGLNDPTTDNHVLDYGFFKQNMGSGGGGVARPDRRVKKGKKAIKETLVQMVGAALA